LFFYFFLRKKKRQRYHKIKYPQFFA